MKKLITITLILLSFGVKAQITPFPVDTTPQYDFYIVNNDSNDFRRTERIIYYSLVKNTGMKAKVWCNKQQDTVSLKWACNVPDDGRIVKMKEIEPIFVYMYLLKQNPSQLAHYKELMLQTSIDADWKWIIGNLQYINKRLLKEVKP